MIEFIDRIKTNTGEIVEEGTPVNRATLMGIQGFIEQTITFNNDGSITETNGLGQIKITTFPNESTIVETFSGTKTITKTTIFNSDGSVSETITEGAN